MRIIFITSYLIIANILFLCIINIPSISNIVMFYLLFQYFLVIGSTHKMVKGYVTFYCLALFL